MELYADVDARVSNPQVDTRLGPKANTDPDSPNTSPKPIASVSGASRTMATTAPSTPTTSSSKTTASPQAILPVALFPSTSTLSDSSTHALTSIRK